MQSNLVVIAVASTVIFVVCLLAWLNMREEQNESLDNVVKNMESHEHDT